MVFSPLSSASTSPDSHHPPEVLASLFPGETSLYPRAHVVLEYLQTFAHVHKLRPHIHCGVRVDAVHPLPGGKWSVTLSTGTTRTFDYLVITTGRYRQPFVPPSLLVSAALQRRLKARTAFHAAWFRSVAHNELKGKRVLLLGGGPSGIDIAIECAGACPQVWWAAARLELPTGWLPKHVTIRGRVMAMEEVSRPPTEGEVDGTSLLKVTWDNGQVENLDVDVIILATGYELVYPFLSEDVLKSQSHAEGIFPFAHKEQDGDKTTSTQLTRTPQAVLPLIQHIFPLSQVPSPTLAFIGLPWKLVPFPISEAQALVAERVFRVGAEASSDSDTIFNVAKERDTLQTRHDALVKEGGRDFAERLWHELSSGPEADQQFAYRRHLLRLAIGKPQLDEQLEQEMQWAEELYDLKVVLRQRWREIEMKGGEATKIWLAGVGEGTREDAMQSWMKLARKLAGTGDVEEEGR